MSLRFVNPEVEDAFVSSRMPRMLRNLSFLLLVMAAIALPSFLINLQLWLTSPEHRARTTWIDRVHMSTFTLYVTVGPLLAALLQVPRIQERIGSGSYEVFVAVLMILVGVREAWVSEQ